MLTRKNSKWYIFIFSAVFFLLGFFGGLSTENARNKPIIARTTKHLDGAIKYIRALEDNSRETAKSYNELRDYQQRTENRQREFDARIKQLREASEDERRIISVNDRAIERGKKISKRLIEISTMGEGY